MTAEDGAIGKIVGVIYRSRSQGGGQDKAVVDVNGGVFLKTVMRLVILHDPVRFEVPGEFKRLTVFINFTCSRIIFVSKLFDFIITDRMAGGFNQPGVNGDALINAQTLAFKLAQDLGVNLIHSLFGESASKARKSGVIRRGFAQRKMQKFFKRPSVIHPVKLFED